MENTTRCVEKLDESAKRYRVIERALLASCRFATPALMAPTLRASTFRVFSLLASTLLASSWLACGSTPTPSAQPVVATASKGPILIFAPHPDDEVLMTAGIIARARAEHRRVRVVIATNGDYACVTSGFVRQNESLEALSDLSVSEEQINFLGYPDGFLPRLGEEPITVSRLNQNGECETASTTYAARGEHRTDLHSMRTGEPAAYVVQSLMDDLIWILEREQPSDVFTSHLADDHPDHALLARLVSQAIGYSNLQQVRVHQAMVHAGRCWPNGSGLQRACPDPRNLRGQPLSELPLSHSMVLMQERVPYPLGAPDKLLLIGHYRSQISATTMEADWLAGFARSDERFSVFDYRAAPVGNSTAPRTGKLR